MNETNTQRLKVTSTVLLKIMIVALTVALTTLLLLPAGVQGSSSSSADETAETSKITIENVILYDKNGVELLEVSKTTAPFKVTILYRDDGLALDDFYDSIDDSSSVLWRNDNASFVRPGSYKGKLTKRAGLGDGIPRFRADFEGITYTGTGTSIGFDVIYVISGARVFASGSAALWQAKTSTEESKDPVIAPLKPHIIVTSQSFGADRIQAGTSFTLDLEYKNTSNTIPLENIIMTLQPSEDLAIAALSNTSYIASIPASGTGSHSLDFKASPASKVGSASIKVVFTYQYIDVANKKREEGTSEEIISIPITQIDRFAIDPITELDSFATVGEPFFVTVSFVNNGNAPTRNISATVTSRTEISAKIVRFGNLAAGAHGEIELSVIAHEEGDLLGEITIQYEDENSTQKELKVSFEIVVEAAYDPGMDHGGGSVVKLPVPEPKTDPMAIVAFSAGCVLAFVPVMLYFVKKSKRKNSEESDYEDF